ncbi:hypothetical protein Ahy_B03g067163 isoform D [Arachis hypogaea]|uniref:Uncharacterized protein n=1 Tax=Arachis hypogaea TaxID=3818 RepID=A0A445A5W7_ARAHY|nr:hypothetical protein Ahy_B03g067163 isoform B [Arachis hypogaea]RYR21853.1 hypothetical protein Ahy_B03g067163 isoform C [Arachis hypogaea]RYR21854.1 hypothetical protein Ahy_B03g067163 isoform D [Arachis hypogaea]
MSSERGKRRITVENEDEEGVASESESESKGRRKKNVASARESKVENEGYIYEGVGMKHCIGLEE